jgi:ssDNA-binding Zn-finger/Zn-ribbon topoisomerase 1
MLLSECQPFEWYLVISCEKCGARQVLFRDPTKGKGRIRDVYEHRCYKCQYVGYYDADQIERYQHVVERRKEARP